MGVTLFVKPIPHRVGLVAIAAAFSLSACAAPSIPGVLPGPQQEHTGWTLVADFEGEDAAAQLATADTQNETDPLVPSPQVTEIRTNAQSGNSYLFRKPAADGIVGNRKALAWIALPRPVEVGEITTFFTRINVEYFPNNHSFGLSNQGREGITKLAYNAFEPMIRVTDKAESDRTQNDGTLMVLTGGKNYSKIINPETGNSARPLVAGEWYDLWYVVDNRRAAAGGQTYSLHVRGGEFSKRTLVYESAKFRIGREEPLTHWLSICNTGPKRQPYGNGGLRYDDIYVASGAVFTEPVRTTYDAGK